MTTGPAAIRRVEVAVAPQSLPTAVAAAVAGKGAIEEAEVVVTPNGVLYEVEVGGGEYLIDANGKLLDQHGDAEDDTD